MPNNHVIPFFIPHVGCPHQCVFCNQVKISGAIQPVKGEEIAQKLEALQNGKRRGYEVAFYGGSFTAIPSEQQEELLKAVQPYFQSGLVCSIRVSTRPDAINQECLCLLREYGVETVELGAQSLHNYVLQTCKRGHTKEDILNGVAQLHERKFSVVLQMMTGLPGDTDQMAMETAEEILALAPEGVRIYPTVVVRGTELFDRYKSGTYTPPTLTQTVQLCAQIYRKFLHAGIPVLRVGLQPTQELTNGEAVAGAYHPALGQLVQSEIFFQAADALLAQMQVGKEIVLGVHSKQVSLMVGQRRVNIQKLSARHGISKIGVQAEAVEPWEICLHSEGRIARIKC